jgi:hypothetical protein
MYPTPVDIDRAAESLKDQVPSQDVTERARQFVHAQASPKPAGSVKRAPRARWLAVAATVAIAGVFLWPRSVSGVSWAQTVQTTLDAPNMIETSYFPNGRIALRIWRSGGKRATLLYQRNGAILWESHSNGKRTASYFDLLASEDPNSLPPNARRFAAVWNDTSHWLSQFELPVQSIDALLHKRGLVILSHKTALETGGADEYRVRISSPYKEELSVIADATSHRIQSMTNTKDKGKELFTYPDKIPDDVFEPRIQEVKGVETYDYAEQNLEVHRRISQGLGKVSPITLRLVVLDSDGALWAFWTGDLPDRRLTHPMRLPGVPTKDPQTFREFTSDHAKAAGAHPAPSIHEWLGGMAVTPKIKLGDTVDVDIPYKGGIAHFHHIPILRTSMLRFVQEELGASHM